MASLAVWRRHRPTLDPAAYLLSMVFEFHHLKLPGVIAHLTQTPCLEDVLLLKGMVNSLGSETMLIGFAARVGCGSHEASMVLSMVFGCCGLFLLELCSLLERKPCLANTLPEVYKGLHKLPQRPQVC